MLHVFNGPTLRGRDCLRMVDFERRLINFPRLAESAGSWSHGERVLLCAAWALFDGGDAEAFVGLLDGEPLAQAVRALSGANLRLLLEAARLRQRE